MTNTTKLPNQDNRQISEHIQEILQQINALSQHPNLHLLKNLIRELQVDATNEESINKNMSIFIHYLQDNPHLAEGFALFLVKLISQYHQITLYTDAGILSDNSFRAEFFALIGHRFLPRLPEAGSLTALITQVFANKKDRLWVKSVARRHWYELLILLNVPDGHEALVNQLKENILQAIVILSYRISGIGLHPEMIKAYPQAMDYHSAFMAQNQEVLDFSNAYRANYLSPANEQTLPLPKADPNQIFVLIDQGENIAQSIRKLVYKTGITVRLTNMLVRLEQHLKRLELLLLLLSLDTFKQKKALLQLLDAFFNGAKNRYSLSYLFEVNTELLSRKVTENASKVGEHYISTDSKGYRQMYKKAAIGGFIIAFMATLKILGYGLDLAPIGVAFLNSMIYGLGFVFIHIIGGTVATKQPAMTAAAIASTISEVTGKKINKLSKLADLVVDIMRTQFIAILGNISIAMPVALLISISWLYFMGEPIIGIKKSDHLLHDLNPLTSLALPHAAIAGIYLYISGLIAGYYDNLAVYNKIGERLRKHPTLSKILSKQRLEQFSDFIERNLGAIMSNFLFGVALGSTATLGVILGLPLDIRHIAFSSANFVHGVFNMYANTGLLPDIDIIFFGLLGVILIGAINLMVSFSLALVTALRSRGVELFEWKDLFNMVSSHFINQPSDFFIPRKKPMHYAKIDSDGNVIYEEKNANQKIPKETDIHSPKNNTSTTEIVTKTEKLTASEIEEKKQAIKDKAIDKPNPHKTANKLPK